MTTSGNSHSLCKYRTTDLVIFKAIYFSGSLETNYRSKETVGRVGYRMAPSLWSANAVSRFRRSIYPYNSKAHAFLLDVAIPGVCYSKLLVGMKTFGLNSYKNYLRGKLKQPDDRWTFLTTNCWCHKMCGMWQYFIKTAYRPSRNHLTFVKTYIRFNINSIVELVFISNRQKLYTL